MLVATGAEASVLTVGGSGFGSIAAAVAAANPNDIIQVVAGTYLDDFAVATINKPLTIEGIGGTAVLKTTTLIPNGKAIFVTRADVTVSNLQFENARVADLNGAGIRQETGNLRVLSSSFVNNEDGILAAGSINDSIFVDKSSFSGNGVNGGGFSHGLYVGTVMKLLTVQNSVFLGTLDGHDVKSRALKTIVTNNLLSDGVSGTSSFEIDLPNGGIGIISGNTLIKGKNAPQRTFIAYGEEGNLLSDNSLLVESNIFTNERPNGATGVFNHVNSVTAQLNCNTFNNVAVPLQGPGVIADTNCGAVVDPVPVPVPEPGTLPILTIGLVGLLARHRLIGRSPAMSAAALLRQA